MLLYASVPGFYAEVERSLDPALAERPVVVGGDPRKRGTVQAATAGARAAGVEEGMPVLEALERCPSARALRTNMRRYREASSRLRACFRRHAERVEAAGLEAAYLETGGDSPEETAAALRDEVREDLGWPLVVGIAPIKFLARLAAQAAGPDGLLRVDRDQLRAFLDPLPLDRLPGVGPKTALRLAELGARTAGDVAALPRPLLEDALGNHGLAIQGYARGQDTAHIRGGAHPRSVSQESTFELGEVDLGQLREALADLARRLEGALALEHLAGRRVVLKLRYEDGEQTTRSRTGVHALKAAAELGEVAEELMARTQAGTRPIRGLGLAVHSMVRVRRDDRQLDLFRPRDPE